MLIIKGKDFELTPVKNTNFFCLKIPNIVNEGKENERIELQIESYNISFESAIEKIVKLRLSKLDKVVSIKEYIALFKKEVEEIEKTTVVENIELP